jgi:3-hydroxyisobutyrate dehydrogenase-like beta-hydroxyacid dehydrogenase
MQAKVGFIGLGQMGKWMALNLVNQGFDLTVFDTDDLAMSSLTERGANGASSPADLVRRVEWIFLCLPNVEVVEQVVFGSDGVAASAESGQIIVDCGTSDYQRTIEIAASLHERDIHFTDAPVTGMEKRAKDATLTIMFGGPVAILDEIRPALEAMGNRIVNMGATGSGQLAKLTNQLLFNVSLAVLAEVLPMAVKLGLDPEKIAQVINTGSGRSFASELFLPNILENRFEDGYSLKNGYKDMVCAAKISALNEIPLPVVKAATTTYQMALGSGLGGEDKGAMIKIFESLSDVKFRKRST